MQDQIKVEKLNDIECEIVINVSSENVNKKFEEFVLGIAPRTQIPGFRKGRVPLQVLKQHLWEKSKPLVAQALIGEYYTSAIKNHNISPVCSPKVKDFNSEAKFQGTFGIDNEFKIALMVEVLPKVDPVGYTGLVLERPELDVAKNIQEKLANYQEQFAERRQITERGIQINDAVVLDFTVMSDGKQIDQSTSFAINKIGKGETLEDFEKSLLGLKINEEKSFLIHFPKQYRVPHLADKEAMFNVKINSIVEVKPAAIDTDLAMMVGFESVEALMQNIKSDVDKEIQIQNRQTMDYQIASKLLELNKFNAPPSLIFNEEKRLLGKKDCATLDQNMKIGLRKLAEFNVKRAILIESIYDHESSLEITPDELNIALEEQSKLTGKTKDEITSNLYNSGQMDGFVGTLKSIKVIDFIIKNATTGLSTNEPAPQLKEKVNE